MLCGKRLTDSIRCAADADLDAVAVIHQRHDVVGNGLLHRCGADLRRTGQGCVRLIDQIRRCERHRCLSESHGKPRIDLENDAIRSFHAVERILQVHRQVHIAVGVRGCDRRDKDGRLCGMDLNRP